MSLHPQVQAFLEGLMAAGARPFHTMTIQDARVAFEGLHHLTGPGPVVASATDILVPGPVGAIQSTLILPNGPVSALIIFVHGGGWVMGSRRDFEALTRSLAHYCGAAVLAPDYRLAPEHPFPAASDDVYAVTKWAAENVVTLVGAKVPVVVAGDSAGGNLAAVAAVRAKEADGPAIALQVLIYPVISSSFDTASMQEFADGPVLSQADVQWFWDNYSADAGSRAGPHASPANADLSGLPPCVVITAEVDPLRDEGEQYAVALRRRGVPAAAWRFRGMIHGFLGFVNHFDAAAEALSLIAKAVQAAAEGRADRWLAEKDAEAARQVNVGETIRTAAAAGHMHMI